MTDQAKGFLQSKTLWAVVITGLAAFFPKLLPKLIGTDFDTSELAQYVVQAIALAVAAYGRITAKQPIAATPIVRQPDVRLMPTPEPEPPPVTPPAPPASPAPKNPNQGW
jgi:hypothetical protein